MCLWRVRNLNLVVYSSAVIPHKVVTARSKFVIVSSTRLTVGRNWLHDLVGDIVRSLSVHVVEFFNHSTSHRL